MSKDQKLVDVNNHLNRTPVDQNKIVQNQTIKEINKNNKDDQANLLNVPKPNPYVIVKKKDAQNIDG